MSFLTKLFGKKNKVENLEQGNTKLQDSVLEELSEEKEPEEVWRYLNNVPGIKDRTYQVSSLGRIRRKTKNGCKYLKGTRGQNRILVCLGKSTYNLGNLVLYGFGKSDSLRGRLNYADGNRFNNKLKNLSSK